MSCESSFYVHSILFSMASGETIANKFKEHEVVPEVVSKAPTSFIKVEFNSGVSANLGNELTPRQVKDTPSVDWEADPSSLYTLVKTDPDAPSRKDPKFREWHHW